MLLRVGTSGYSYKEWKGTFYPSDLPASKMLPYYAERFSTVEINNTFYRMPAPAALDGWAAQVPEGFRFALKAPQRITHQKKLAGTEDDVRFLVQTAATLGEHLGPLLFQLPPTSAPTSAASAPSSMRFPRAFASPSSSATTAGPTRPSRTRSPRPGPLSAPQTPRIGPSTASSRRRDGGTSASAGPTIEEGDLAAWADRIAAAPWEEAWVFFKHEEEGKGPAYATRFLELAGARGLRCA